jgi:hypothetical protein
LVTVVKPQGSEFAAGGGFLVLTSSAGIKAGDMGSKNNFGFNIKYNRSGKSLTGQVNIIVRRTEMVPSLKGGSGTVLRVYQIKGNVMSSLATNPGSGVATATGKASIQDVTNPNNPIPVDGNASFQLTMDDNGEPGTGDTLGITVWNKSGGLWFSSKWNGTKTVEQTIGGGNLMVR